MDISRRSGHNPGAGVRVGATPMGGRDPLYNNPLLNKREKIREAYEREGRNAPLMGGKTASERLLKIIPSYQFPKITAEMWENMRLMEDTRNIWGQDRQLESDPVMLNGRNAVFRHPQPRRWINASVGYNARPDRELHTL